MKKQSWDLRLEDNHDAVIGLIWLCANLCDFRFSIKVRLFHTWYFIRWWVWPIIALVRSMQQRRTFGHERQTLQMNIECGVYFSDLLSLYSLHSLFGDCSDWGFLFSTFPCFAGSRCGHQFGALACWCSKFLYGHEVVWFRCYCVARAEICLTWLEIDPYCAQEI